MEDVIVSSALSFVFGVITSGTIAYMSFSKNMNLLQHQLVEMTKQQVESQQSMKKLQEDMDAMKLELALLTQKHKILFQGADLV